ncbi:MAG TPA: tetratricopeptide repeat protein, partial [Rhodanobacteraceae bacterium]|nr:tetratricopeptide repeat protein [Rhodanobacteraceae bacterium]
MPALMAIVLVCLAGLPGPRAHDLTPEAAAHIAGTWRLLAGAASDTWRSLDTVLSPLIGVRGRFELARAAGTLQLLLGGVGDEASAPWAVAEAQARRLGREALALDALRVQVEMQLSGGNYGAADALTAQLLERARAAGNGAFQASAEGFLGILARRHGELEAARQHQENALALRRALGDDAGIAQALANLGTVYRDLGDFARALDLQLEALDLRRRLGLGEGVDLSYRNIALLYREIEDAEQARANFSAALAAAEARHDPASLATVLGSFASFCNDNGEPNA